MFVVIVFCFDSGCTLVKMGQVTNFTIVGGTASISAQ